MGYLRSSAQTLSKATTGNGDRGLTLVESLVAITVVGVTGLLVTPPLFISAATRVQNRRAEQALGIAQGEIDRVRLLVERNRQTVDTPIAGQTLPPAVLDIDAAPAPTTLSNILLESPNPDFDSFNGQALPNARTALPIDVDGDGEVDFFMQTFRSQGRTGSDPNQLESFRMGVRVYAIAAEDRLGNLSVEEANLRYTTGLGNQQQRPLAVLYSDFARSDRSNSVCQYKSLEGTCPATTP